MRHRQVFWLRILAYPGLPRCGTNAHSQFRIQWPLLGTLPVTAAGPRRTFHTTSNTEVGWATGLPYSDGAIAPSTCAYGCKGFDLDEGLSSLSFVSPQRSN